jgi:hypothetical protein
VAADCSAIIAEVGAENHLWLSNDRWPHHGVWKRRHRWAEIAGLVAKAKAESSASFLFAHAPKAVLDAAHPNSERKRGKQTRSSTSAPVRSHA